MPTGKKASSEKLPPISSKVSQKIGKEAAFTQALPDEDWWIRLIGNIADGNVIPVIGSGLLCYLDEKNPGKTICFFRELADRLIVRWGLLNVSRDSRGRMALHEVVVARQISGRLAGGESEQIYLENAYRDIAEEAELLDFPITDLLAKLASVDGFHTYLTTLFDRSLFHALTDKGREVTKGSFWPEFPSQLRPSAKSRKLVSLEADLSQDILDGEDSGDADQTACQVYQLLGSSEIRSPYAFAVWDNDILNWAMALHDHCPEVLEDCFRSKHILYLGLECDDWLTRFLLRIANRAPLEKVEVKNYFADRGSSRNTLIFQFFESLGPSRFSAVELGDDGLKLFVDELERRWNLYKISADPPVPVKREIRFTLPSKRPPQGKFIFISYSRKTDMDLAKEVKGELDKLGILAWIDLNKTTLASPWKVYVEDAIRRCCLFIAIISDEALALEDGYFYGEWKQITERWVNKKSSAKLCVPLFVGDTDATHIDIPEPFRKATRLRIQGGGPWGEFNDRIKELWDEIDE